MMITKDIVCPPRAATTQSNPAGCGVAISFSTRLVPMENSEIQPRVAFVRSWWQSRHDESCLQGTCFTAIFSDGEIITFRRLNDMSYQAVQIAPPSDWEVSALPLCICFADRERFAIITSEAHAFQCREIATFSLKKEPK